MEGGLFPCVILTSLNEDEREQKTLLSGLQA